MTLAIGVLVGLVVCLLVVLGGLVFFHDRALPGVKVIHVAVGGKSQDEIHAILEQLVSARGPELHFVHEGKTWTWDLQQLGYVPATHATAKTAVAWGKNIQTWTELPRLWSTTTDLPLAYEIPESQLDRAVSEIAEEVWEPAIDPEIQVSSSGAVLVQKGTLGQEIDRQALLAEVEQRLVWLRGGQIELPVLIYDRRIDDVQAEETRIRAEQMLKKKVTLKVFDTELVWEGQVLAGLMGFDGGFSEQKIRSQISELALAVNRLPENAVFEFDETTGKVKEFKAERPGLVIQESEAIKDLKIALENLERDATDSADLALATEETDAKVKVADMNSLGIKELIGKGESWFKGSIASRVHNVELAAARLNGAVIAPGEVISFVNLVGDISRATGFQAAYVIQGGRTVLGDGGGVCQVSSTLFRAALNTGLPIEERKAHSYRVGYYEQQSHPGLDATIYAPSVDLKIRNDTPAHILIQTKLDKKNSHLVFEIYGTSDGRIAEVGNYKLWNQVAPPPPLYQDDPTLPPGTIKQVEHAAWGAKASFDWKVTRNGETIQEKTFFSTFRAWQAVYLKGPSV